MLVVRMVRTSSENSPPGRWPSPPPSSTELANSPSRTERAACTIAASRSAVFSINSASPPATRGGWAARTRAAASSAAVCVRMSRSSTRKATRSRAVSVGSQLSEKNGAVPVWEGIGSISGPNRGIRVDRG